MSPTLAPTPGEFGARENGRGGLCARARGGAGSTCVQLCQVRTGDTGSAPTAAPPGSKRDLAWPQVQSAGGSCVATLPNRRPPSL